MIWVKSVISNKVDSQWYFLFDAINVHLLGQVVDGVHDWDSSLAPTHCLPSYWGAGSVQVLVLVSVPVVVPPTVWQVMEQAPYAPQEAQLPSTRIHIQHIID
jgi:hypothetical protein